MAEPITARAWAWDRFVALAGAARAVLELCSRLGIRLVKRAWRRGRSLRRADLSMSRQVGISTRPRIWRMGGLKHH